ncbi:hypothetical protein MA04_01787 [Alcanivorax balearicus MACL04]|uniref:Tetratricopeptide repeat protein n=1 Tax=Alloalcanivorax balearicus MACL04 TaxID=1177182 RepID=A0ABT2QYA5_9GAMM|nr:hypothetical protein [Alloalcanivorax balearicus MACL04]
MPVDEAGRLHATGYSRASSLLTERGNYEAAVPLWELACKRIEEGTRAKKIRLQRPAARTSSHSGVVVPSVGASLLANPGQQAATAAL